MNIIERFRPWWGRKVVRGFFVVALLLIIGVVALSGNSEEVAEVSAEPTAPSVQVTSMATYNGASSLSLIGTARAFTEAQVTAERAGRVVAVNVTLGQTVAAGQIIALLESASERAAVTQAEGAYEAAQAATAQSGVGVDEANNNLVNTQNAAITTVRNSFTTVQGVIVNNIDSFFSNPNGMIPGLRINGRGNTSFLNSERVAYQTLLPEWQTETNTLQADGLTVALTEAQVRVQRTLTLVDTFISIFTDQSSGTSYTDEELQSFSTTFSGLRSTLLATLSSLEQAESSLLAAEDGVKRAQIASSGGTTSAADAQIKQALGALQAAQANLAKSVLRSPISGTVNALDIRTGDFVGSFTTIATVANNAALEVVTFVGDGERAQFEVDNEVTINDRFAGRVVAVSPALDPITRKTEVRIAIEDTTIANGDTVRITTASTTGASLLDESVPRLIPLTAVKFSATDGIVFVVEDSRLVERRVELGEIRGSSVVVESGLETDTRFVRDARGLVAGETVDVAE